MNDKPAVTADQRRDQVARIIDPEAWAAAFDGRDKLPDSLWHLRRDVAFKKADAILAHTALQRQESADDIIERCACVASEAGFASSHVVAERIRALKSAQVAEQQQEVKP